MLSTGMLMSERQYHKGVYVAACDAKTTMTNRFTVKIPATMATVTGSHHDDISNRGIDQALASRRATTQRQQINRTVVLRQT